MAYDLAALTRSLALDSLPQEQAGLLLTARLWVLMRKRGLDPAVTMAERLGSPEAAWRLWLLMEEVGTAWPDPFLVSPPCCRRLSHDERVLLDMLSLAGSGERLPFLRLLQEMIPVETADRLHTSAVAFLAALSTGVQAVETTPTGPAAAGSPRA